MVKKKEIRITKSVYVDNKNKWIEITDTEGNKYYFGFEGFDKLINKEFFRK